jgi:hypothetical protein
MKDVGPTPPRPPRGPWELRLSCPCGTSFTAEELDVHGGVRSCYNTRVGGLMDESFYWVLCPQCGETRGIHESNLPVQLWQAVRADPHRWHDAPVHQGTDQATAQSDNPHSDSPDKVDARA